MTLPEIAEDMSADDMATMLSSARDASAFLKSISHEARLMILCHLAMGEKSVTELEQLLSMRQAAVSQQLSRLRQDGLVAPRRDGKTMNYSILDPRAQEIVGVLYDLFCKPKQP